MPDHLITGGLVRFGHHHLGWARAGRGWGHQLPPLVLEWIADGWNAVACRLWGHDWAPINFQGYGTGRVLVTVGCLGCARNLGRVWSANVEPALVDGAPDA